MHQEMSTAMKRIKKMGGLKGMAAMLGKGGLGGLGNAMGGPGLGDMMGKLGGPAGGGLPGLPGAGGDAPKLPPGFENLLKKK
jgi:signal recognition particle subunit SRP54